MERWENRPELAAGSLSRLRAAAYTTPHNALHIAGGAVAKGGRGTGDGRGIRRSMHRSAHLRGRGSRGGGAGGGEPRQAAGRNLHAPHMLSCEPEPQTDCYKRTWSDSPPVSPHSRRALSTPGPSSSLSSFIIPT
eukprot:351613-Chlamydomonas_euryale.AAC.7